MLGDLAPVSRHTSTKRQKKGSRLANRRVSFAPDDQLKTMHLYTKVCTGAPSRQHKVQNISTLYEHCLTQRSSTVAIAQDDERQATPEKGRAAVQETEAQAQAFPEHDLTDGEGNPSMPVYGLDSWNQELQALSPLDSFASPSAVSMELTDISQEYDYQQNSDLSHNLTGESEDRTKGMYS